MIFKVYLALISYVSVSSIICFCFSCFFFKKSQQLAFIKLCTTKAIHAVCNHTKVDYGAFDHLQGFNV